MKTNLEDKNKSHQIVIIQYLDREELVAEVWFNRCQWCTVFRKNTSLMIEFYPHPRNQDWEFSCEEALEVLDQAKIQFLKRINEINPLCAVCPETPGEANRFGQGLLEEILDHPQAQVYQNRFGGKDIFEPSGKGARFNKEERFLGFLQGARLEDGKFMGFLGSHENFSINLASLPDRQQLVAEVFYERVQWVGFCRNENSSGCGNGGLRINGNCFWRD